MLPSLNYLINLETENRTLQEIEEHFGGIEKLPHSLKKNSLPSSPKFPENFDIKTWENNDKFEQYLHDHKIGTTDTHL